jgi:protein gp37
MIAWDATGLASHTGIHWLISGGEGGPGFRACNEAWVRDLRDRCIAGGVAEAVRSLSPPRRQRHNPMG